MFTIIGLVVVFGSVLGGFAMVGGPIHVLIQPARAGRHRRRRGRHADRRGAREDARAACFGTIGKAFKAIAARPRQDYLELLKLQYEVFSFMRKNGAVALDEHVNDVEKSAIFSKYPSFLKRHHAVEFFRDALKQIVNGTASAEELDVLLDAELDTHHEEAHIPVGAPPEDGRLAARPRHRRRRARHHRHHGPPRRAAPRRSAITSRAALVGTFLGILLCYGLFHPIATNVELQDIANGKYLRCIKEGVVASLTRRGADRRGRVRAQGDLLRRAADERRDRRGLPEP